MHDFLIEDDDLFQKYNTVWNKVSTDIKKEFDNKPVFNKELSKTKIRYHRDEVTDFFYPIKKIPKVGSNHTV